MTDKTCTISTPGGKDRRDAADRVQEHPGHRRRRCGPYPVRHQPDQVQRRQRRHLLRAGFDRRLQQWRLVNQASANAATNVRLQLLGSNNQFLPIKAAGAGLAQTNSQWVTVGTDGSADLNYYAEYYATAPPPRATSPAASSTRSSTTDRSHAPLAGVRAGRFHAGHTPRA